MLANLRLLAAGRGLAVAFSGGVDSRFLCHAALAAGVDVLAVHARGAHMPERESRYAEAWAARRSLPLRTLEADVLALPEVAGNSRERCYHCKRHMLGLLGRHAGERVLCDGTNADDLAAHRPGLRALREAGVRSPLAEAGLGKTAIRALGAATGLEAPQQPARPCLLTRLAYGMPAQAALLRRAEAAEAALEALGLKDFRLRLTPAPVVQVVSLPEDLGASILETLVEHGFSGARLLVENQISGFFDRPQCRVKRH